MQKSRTFQLKNPLVDSDGVLFVIVIDNSESMFSTEVEGRTLFDVQLEMFNRLVWALNTSKISEKAWILVTTLSGVFTPGWIRMDELERFSPEMFVPTRTTPILDVVAGLLEGIEVVYRKQEDSGRSPRVSLVMCTDGLDGFSVNGENYPVSISSEESVNERVHTFLESGFFLSALAIGGDGGRHVASFYRRIGIPSESILQSGLTLSELRRAFGTSTEQTILNCANLNP